MLKFDFLLSVAQLNLIDSQSQIQEILSLNLLFTFTELCANAAENLLRRVYYHYLTFTQN